MKGRKPLPDKIVNIKGRQHYHRQRGVKTADIPSGIPECPDNLDEEARKEWDRLIDILDPSQIITEADRATLAAVCYHWSVWVHATKQITEHNMVAKAPSGFPIQNPFFPIANKAFDNMLKCLIELGCTPSARSRVKVSAPKSAENKKDRFFS